jgi:hypothetical protein
MQCSPDICKIQKARTVPRPGFLICCLKRLLLARRYVRAATVRHFCRHADAFAQRGVGVNGFADVHRVCAHLDGQRDLADHVARVRADHATAQDLAVAVGLRRIVKQQFGHAFCLTLRRKRATITA